MSPMSSPSRMMFGSTHLSGASRSAWVRQFSRHSVSLRAMDLGHGPWTIINYPPALVVE
jgi:hypothetical protein